jgi:Zn-finger nucleic acid-binding protein
MDCPRCKEKMEQTLTKGIGTHTCLYCNGTWIDSSSFKNILGNEQNTSLQTGIKRSFHALKERNESRLCPECSDQQLFQLIVQGVELDLCPECIGIFFDEGELKELLPQLETKSNETGVGSYLVGEGLFWAILAFLFSGS